MSRADDAGRGTETADRPRALAAAGAGQGQAPPEEIIGMLEGAEAYLSGHFRLSSGLHSTRYLQCAVALQHPGLAGRLGAALAGRWRAAGHEAPDVVVSPALGGVVIGHEVGRALGVRAVFTERVDGDMTLRRGFHLASGEGVLIVEDVVTTGRSSRETAAAVRDAGGVPVGVACIANRSGRRRVDELPLVALVDLDLPSHEPSDCPACAAGEPLVKPGSRPPA